MKRKFPKHLLILSFILLSLSCKKDQEEKNIEEREEISTLFKMMSPSETGIDFFNKVENQKDFNIFKYRNFYNGGGVAIGDINNDGLADIYLTANMGPNKLYLNKGDFKFEDISKSAGIEGSKPWSTGVNMVDINADGLLDIYVSNAGNMKGNNHDNDLYINNGDLTFTEMAEEYNLAKTGFSTHASFFDYDKDGDLDAYILNNSNIPVSSLGYAEQRHVRAQDWENVPHIFRGVGDMLLRNDDGKFVDVSEEAGIYGSLIGFGLGVMVSDINKDLYPDIYISNDFYERDYLYINNQDGTFSEQIKDWTNHLSLSAMGVDMADINNDGHNEIFITDMLPEPEERVKSVMEFEGYNVFRLKRDKDFFHQYIQNTLQLNNGNNTFSEVAYFSGIEATDWSWAGLIFDMDNDGLRDIFITNGINHDLTDLDFVDFFADEIIQKMALTGQKASIDSIIEKMPIKPQANYAYKNNGDLTFSKENKNWGFETLSMSNGVAYGDLDNDGDLDLVVNNVNMDAFVYKNTAFETTDNNYIKFKLQGGDKNKFAIGTTLNLYAGEQIIHQEQMPSRGFQSSMDYDITIGLGAIDKIDSIEVIWPNDYVTQLKDVDINQTLSLAQSDADGPYQKKNVANSTTLLSEIKNSNLIKHEENPYSDFDYEGLIYQLVSQEGPAMTVGDIDNDGNDDIFIGGARDQAATLYLHSGNGNLRPKTMQAFIDDAQYEDTAAAFFDADGDSDLDLVVGSGGNEVGRSDLLINRLYLNDGKGNFTNSANEMPLTRNNVSTIAAEDYDKDGDIDLFLGTRNSVGVYGVDPEHVFLENTGGGTFKNSTERIIYEVKDAGMITAAIWKDYDQDGNMDLITVSEWGTPIIYKNNGRRLNKIESDLDSLTGWWNTVAAEDLDKDGDLDLILGNQGTNIHYKPEQDAPMKMWINDFDNNGTIEQIITQTIDGKDFPIHQKKELMGQIVSLKKQNIKASDYAKRTIQELFSAEVINNSIVKSVSYAESLIAVNEGEGKFSVKALPSRVQLSCVCGISCIDVNNDGHLDLVMAGNNYEFKPQFSRIDASYGNVLLGDGAMNFNWQDYNKSGFFVRDEVKHLAQFKDKQGNSFLITAINNGSPKVFKANE